MEWLNQVCTQGSLASWEADRGSKLADNIRGKSTVRREVDNSVFLYSTQDIYEYVELQTKPLQRCPYCPLLRLQVKSLMLVAEDPEPWVVQEGWESEVGEDTGDPRGPEQA